jgi:hypothetical protein
VKKGDDAEEDAEENADTEEGLDDATRSLSPIHKKK